MAVIDLTKDNFESTLNSHDVLIVDFWAPWCAPCKAFAPVFEAAAERHAGVVFAKVDTEAQPELAGYFQIRSIPTLMVFREQVILYSEAGSLPTNALDSLLEQVMGMDMEQVHKDIAAQQTGQA